MIANYFVVCQPVGSYPVLYRVLPLARATSVASSSTVHKHHKRCCWKRNTVNVHSQKIPKPTSDPRQMVNCKTHISKRFDSSVC